MVAALRSAAETALLGALLSAPWTTPVLAQSSETPPQELAGLGIFHQGGAALPLDLEFTDSAGQRVALNDFFGSGRPVLLTLVYYDCPMLCNILLDSFVKGLKDLEWTAGQEFEIVTVSIDPKDTVAAAVLKKDHQIEHYERPSAAAGWHFLLGDEPAILKLADTVGFKFAYNDERGEYMHAAGIFVITPEGKVSQTLLGLDFPAKTLRLSLVEASAGKIGNALDQALLFCFYYDATTGRYAPAAMNLMRLGGGVTVLVLALWLSSAWRRDRRRRRLAAEGIPS